MNKFTLLEWQKKMLEGENLSSGKRRKSFVMPQFEPIPKTPYLYWFIKLGGNYSKNKMPRGKKFKQAIAPYLNGRFSIQVQVNKSMADKFRSKQPISPLFIDEMEKFS